MGTCGEHRHRLRNECDSGHRTRLDEVALDSHEAGGCTGLGLTVVFVAAHGADKAESLGRAREIPCMRQLAVILVLVVENGTAITAFAYEPEREAVPGRDSSRKVHEVLLCRSGFGREGERSSHDALIRDQQEQLAFTPKNVIGGSNRPVEKAPIRVVANRFVDAHTACPPVALTERVASGDPYATLVSPPRRLSSAAEPAGKPSCRPGL